MARRLTITEKQLRGTHQRAYDPTPRTVADIQADIDWQLETVDSLKLTARQAAEAVKRLGPTVPTGRGSAEATKPNPALRIQGWALAEIRRVRRELVFLNEELALAQGKENDAALALDDEFAGL